MKFVDPGLFMLGGSLFSLLLFCYLKIHNRGRNNVSSSPKAIELKQPTAIIENAKPSPEEAFISASQISLPLAITPKPNVAQPQKRTQPFPPLFARLVKSNAT